MNKFSLGLFLVCLSAQGIAGPLRIIGEDNRVQIPDNGRSDVYDNIGYLRIVSSGYSTGSCTATLISEYHAITAAHCLYDLDKHSWITGASFFPGVRSDITKRKFPYGHFVVKKKRVLKDYIAQESYMYDVGLITFTEKVPVIPNRLGILPKGERFSIAGYPGDKVDGTLWEATGKRNREMFGFGKETVEHDADTYPGQSGSAVRYGDEVVGVHSGGTINKDFNMAYFFDQKMIDNLQSWMKEDFELIKKGKIK